MGWRKAESTGNLIWDFTTNPELEGGFVKVDLNVGPNNSKMYHLKTATEEVCFWGNTVLDGRLEEAKVGDRVKIVFKGMATSPKSGREYKDFEVFFWDEALKKTDSDII